MCKGIPCIKGAQEREALKMNNAATIATFFAGVVGAHVNSQTRVAIHLHLM